MDNKKYNIYKTNRDIEEGLKMLKEAYTFNDEPEEPVAAAEETVSVKAPVENDTDFMDKEESNFNTSDETVAQLRKLVFKALSECQDDITSEKYNTMKKIWNLLDGLALPKSGADGNK